MAPFPIIERARETLALRDPKGETIATGGIAIAAQLAEVGLAYPTRDVDTLSSEEYMLSLWRRAPGFTNVVEVTWHNPCSHSLLYGNTAVSVSVAPDPVCAPNIMPFSATPSMTNIWTIMDYALCRERPELLVVASGIRCLRMAEILSMKAKVGRGKDIAAVDQVAPQALKHELLSEPQYTEIMRLRDRSAARGELACAVCLERKNAA